MLDSRLFAKKSADPYKMSHGMYTKHGSFDPFHPDVELLDIRDIAYGLSRQTRFNGHIPITIAQHSVMVSNMCSSKNKLAGLMHDAAEAYFGDWIRPHKKSMWFEIDGKLRKAEYWEDQLLCVIFDWLGMREGLSENVHLADSQACNLEIKDRERQKYWSAAEAEELFLLHFERLYKCK